MQYTKMETHIQQITPDLQVNLTKMKNILDNDYSKYPTTVQDTLKAW